MKRIDAAQRQPRVTEPAFDYLPSPLVRLENLNVRLRAERESLGVLQCWIAMELQHARMTVYRWENGEQLPSIAALEGLQRLGLNVFHVLSGERHDSIAARGFLVNTAGFGARLRLERERIGFEQAALAQALGITRATQSRYENGNALPSLEYLAGAQAFGLDARFLLCAQRSALLIGWSDCERLAQAMDTVPGLLAEDERTSTLAIADKLLQVLFGAFQPRSAGALLRAATHA